MPSRAKPVVDSFGRILLPKHLRDSVGLRPGMKVDFIAERGGLRLMPRRLASSLTEKQGILIVPARRVTGDLDSALRNLRSARAKRLASLRR
jgi:AbrB family looped-hinge helix DNA binding protein